MNEHERQIAIRHGRAIRSARKLRGYSQAQLSQKLNLGITQATMSNIEKGRTSISTVHWYRLAEFLNIPAAYAFYEGVIDNIDHHEDPKETGFKIPRHYTNNAHSTIRGSQPFFRFFVSRHGEAALESFLKEKLKIDPDTRFVYNLRLSVRFNCDIAAFLINAGDLKLDSIDELTAALMNPKTHGTLAAEYKFARNRLDLVKTLVKYISRYEQNFNYAIINEAGNSIDIQSTPAEFMRYFSYKEDELPNFINLYRLSFLQSFLKYLPSPEPARVSLIPSKTKRKTECIFRIQV